MSYSAKKSKDREIHKSNFDKPSMVKEITDSLKLNLEIITPGIAKDRIEEYFKKTQDINLRSAFCSKILVELCKNGYSQEAWQLIEDGSGQVRNSELMTFFQSADLPIADLLRKIEKLEYKTDAYPAFAGLLLKFEPSLLETTLASEDMVLLMKTMEQNNFNINISSSVYLSLSASSKNSDAKEMIDVARRLNSEGLLDSSDYLSLLDKSTLNIFDKWELLDNVDFENSRRSAEATNTRNKVIETMISSDAPKAISKIFQSGEERQQSIDLITAIGAWTNIDPSGAAEWYQINQLNLSRPQRDSISISFSLAAARSLEFNGALLWARQIQDQKIRDDTTEAIRLSMEEHEDAN